LTNMSPCIYNYPLMICLLIDLLSPCLFFQFMGYRFIFPMFRNPWIQTCLIWEGIIKVRTFSRGIDRLTFLSCTKFLFHLINYINNSIISYCTNDVSIKLAV
ncbi:hypothetical protein ACJX0J_031076, partial [Zea mays]